MRLVILGAGGYGQTIADVARQSKKYDEIIFLDDAADQAEVKGRCQDYPEFVDLETEIYPAFGNNEVRLRWLHLFEELGLSVMTLVHPLAYVSPQAVIGEGTVVLPYAMVNTNCRIGKGCIINCGAIVDHGCILSEGVHVAPGGIVKAENQISPMSKIDSGEVIAVREYPIE